MVPMEDSNETLGGKKKNEVLQQSTLPALGLNNDTILGGKGGCSVSPSALSEMKYSILFLPTLDCSAIITLSNHKYSQVGRNNLTREDALGDHTVITVLY